jgi:hypothetical protein
MKSFASIILIFGGASVLLASFGYGAMIWPWLGFDEVSKALQPVKIGLGLGAVAIVAGFLLRNTEHRQKPRDTMFSPRLQAKEDDLKRRANEGRL